MRTESSGFGVPRQLAFDWIPPPPPPPSRTSKGGSHNLYFAVLPEPEVAGRMGAMGAELKQRFNLPGRVQPAHLLHISMAHVGRFASVPESIVAMARRGGNAVRSTPFEVCFDHARSFDNPRRSPVVLRCSRGDAEFEDLRRSIVTAMVRIGIAEPQPIGLTPHVTLVYEGRPIHPIVLAEPISWTVREFVLVHSLVGRGRHIHLGRWPLSG